MRAILATDFGPLPSTALLQTLAWPPRSELEIVHVVAHSAAGRVASTVDERNDLARGLAVGLRETLPALRVRNTTLVGEIVGELVRRAGEIQADLMIVGAPRRHVWCRGRSVVAHLVARTACALLVARTDRISRLLLVDDGTPASDAALRMIEESTLLPSLPVAVVRALDLDSTIATPRRTLFVQEPPEYVEARDVANVRLEERVARLTLSGRSAFGVVRGGPPRDEVLHVARALRVDTVVLGAPTPAGRWSTLARRVALEADCSVLIAP